MSRPEIDELIRQSEELAATLPSAEAAPGEPDEELDARVRADNVRRLAGEPVQTRGYAVLSVSDDQMEVTGHVYPPTGQQEFVTVDDVARLLRDRGISFGIDWNAIKSAVWTCNTERREVHDVIVARGRKPVATIPEHVGLKKALMRQVKRKQLQRAGKEQLDYRSVSPFVIVQKGDVLARDIPQREGTMGATVFGESIPYGTETKPPLKPGRNIRREGGYYLADTEGRLEWGRDYFRVNQVLELSEGVDYRTGHIEFPGDVIIHRAVRDGFRIHAGGSVYCMDTLDASEVQCEGDLVARRGIIGRNDAKVQVGGSVEARYIENCYLEAKGNVRAETGIVNSFVNSLQTVETGKRGIIVGGKIFAVHGVTAAQLGTSMGPKTEIHCGIDFSVSHRLKWIQDKSTEIAFQLQQIKQRVKQEPESAEALQEVKARLENGLQTLQESAEALVVKLDKDDAAQVCATGAVYAGVYIEISHVAYQANRPMHRLCFRLDKESGRIVTE